ncbi:Type IV fimbrial biogenesis protein PilY1 [Rubrivivax sp. A210]|uniref:pilus assembly protein n=1 Tax=Rubrivivax sp. A210 TaxID=2772301 RepID=UPI001917C43F|nr:PilC/PilY family type IV pilus protein [Rubrivivax sp. A210]CAD5371845.1 Type IV fimbrial biogenesis protein PilY1 [Rubrivivax sp. A210]
MRLSLTHRLSAVLLCAAACGPARAQTSDIDVYGTANPSSDRPNVLLVLDASANWNPSVGGTCYFKDGNVNNGQPSNQGSKYAVEICALYNLIDALPLASNGSALFNVGIMLTNAKPDNHKGGYPRQAFTPLDATGKAALKAAIRGIGYGSDDKANLAQLSLMLHEAYLYFKGLAPRVGNLNTPWDSTSVSGGVYASPSANSCGRNYVILIANGGPTNGENGDAEALLRGLGGTAAATKIADPNLGNNDANWADEYARFMRAADVSNKVDVQGIITHGVAVIDPAKSNIKSEIEYRNFTRSIANYGGGNYYEASETDVLVRSLLDIFNQIQAVNSVFASASLPVSVNARGTYMNQVYMGMFRPDADGKPRWRGNLKQYRFGLDATDSLYLVDAYGRAAISSSTGFLSPSAVSFWTRSSTFWANQLMGTPPTSSDAPDGEVVEKGSVAQGLRSRYATSQEERHVYTCIGCTTTAVSLGSDATEFEADNSAITAVMLGAASSTERAALINWVRGTSNAGDEAGPTTTTPTTVRPSIHGDVLHSRPAVLNYGGSTGVVVFYGANDGQLRAVNGNQSGSGAGAELWSFVPQEHFAALSRLRSNTPEVRLSTTPATATASARDYFVDGPIGVYAKFEASGVIDDAWIFVGMRRGGRYLYAFDVSDPLRPRFMWKLTPSSTGMSLLGQTWSEAKAARVKGIDDPVLIMGGGYDAAAEDGSATTTMGHAVYVLNARTGALLRAFTTLHAVTPGSIGRSVAADVTLMDSDADGKIDRAYAVDLGGQVYRIDFESEAGATLAAANWTIYKVADLSEGTATGRKFFFAPDVVATRSFTALMLGSGDREKPLLSATQDHFFEIFDRRIAKGVPSATTPIAWSTLYAMGSGDGRVDGNGCYLALDQGEKVVNAAASIGGSSYFGTNRPAGATAGNVCAANLGVAKTYAMPLFCVAAAGQVVEGGGMPPSPVAGIVGVTNLSGKLVYVPFVIGAPNARHSAIEGSRLRPTVDVPRKRKYWFQETQR